MSPFLELGVGFNPELTARENIFLSGSILGLNRPELHRLFDEIIGFADLEQFVDHKLKNFSSGMEVRLAFSLAIQAHAEILMMDEVLAVGDAAFQEKCFDTFNRYKREGRTVVLVTHGLAAVTTYCDRALLLDHGRLVADGETADVTAQYRRAIAPPPTARSRPTRSSAGARETLCSPACACSTSAGLRTATHPTGGFVRIELGYEIQNDAVSDFVCTLWLLRADGLMVSELQLPVSQYAQVGESQRGSGCHDALRHPSDPPADGRLQRRGRAAWAAGRCRLRPHQARDRLPGHRQAGPARGDRAGGAWSVVPADQPVAWRPTALPGVGQDERPVRRRR